MPASAPHHPRVVFSEPHAAIARVGSPKPPARTRPGQRRRGRGHSLCARSVPADDCPLVSRQPHAAAAGGRAPRRRQAARRRRSAGSGRTGAMERCQRTAANLAAIRVLTSASPVGKDEKAILRRYSGWGGLSLDKAAGQIPAELVPDIQALNNESLHPAVGHSRGRPPGRAVAGRPWAWGARCLG